MVRIISLEEWEKTRKDSSVEMPLRVRNESIREKRKQAKKLFVLSFRVSVFSGMLIGAVLGSYFHGDFTRWIFEGALIGAIPHIIKFGKNLTNR